MNTLEKNNFLKGEPWHNGFSEDLAEKMETLITRLEADRIKGIEKITKNLRKKFFDWLVAEQLGRTQNYDWKNGYAEGNVVGYGKGIRKGFQAGIDFVFQYFPFLVDVVDKRIKNGDLEEYTKFSNGFPRFDKEEWDKEVEEYIEKYKI